MLPYALSFFFSQLPHTHKHTHTLTHTDEHSYPLPIFQLPLAHTLSIGPNSLNACIVLVLTTNSYFIQVHSDFFFFAVKVSRNRCIETQIHTFFYQSQVFTHIFVVYTHTHTHTHENSEPQTLVHLLHYTVTRHSRSKGAASFVYTD